VCNVRRLLGTFSRLERVESGLWTRAGAWARNAPWLEFTLLAYGAWRCHGLLQTWFTAPYDQLGWLAFAFWILPLGLNAQSIGLPTAGSGRKRPWCLAAGLALICLGDAGAINALKHLGLALILIGFAPRSGRKLWALGAIAWMPALGWAASRLGVDPAGVGMGRAVIAMCSCAWWLGAQQTECRTEELNYVGSIKTTI
jgi:hypothetical protein